MRIVLTMVFSALLLACGSETEPVAEAPDEVAPPSEACVRDAARIESAFARPEGSSLFRGVSPAPFAPRGTELEIPLPRLVVSTDQIVIDDVEVRGEGAPAALAAEMGVRASLAGDGDATDHGVPSAEGVLLYVPSHTPVSRLRHALSEVDPVLRYDLIVQHSGGGAPEEPQPPPWLDEELHTMQQVPGIAARRERFRGLFTRAAGECTEARAHAPFLFGRDPSVPEQAEPTDSLSESMLECRCAGVEVDAMVAIGILTGPPNRRPLRRLSFVRVAEAREGAVEALDSQTIEDLVTALAAAEAPRRVFFIAPDAREVGQR